MKKVGLFIYVAYGSGGMFQYNQQILEALLSFPANEMKLTVFHVDDAWGSIVPAHVQRRKVSFPSSIDTLLKVLFRLRCPDFLLRFLFRLTDLKQISDGKFDLVIFPSQDLAGIFLTNRSINVVHDIMHRYEPQFKESSSMGRGKFRDRLFKAFCESSARVLVDSNVGKAQLMESYAAKGDNIAALPYIAPSHITGYDDTPNQKYFESLGLPPKYFFYPAQFWPHKNHKILIEASALLRDELPDLKLVFLGPKRHAYLELVQLIEERHLSDRVQFYDFMPNEVLGGFYLRARAMLMPTYYGPTNIPPLEAIALGCPCAVSNIYGMPEQLGNAALYFDHRNAESVAKVMASLWKDDEVCERLRANSKLHTMKWNQAAFNLKFHDIISGCL